MVNQGVVGRSTADEAPSAVGSLLRGGDFRLAESSTPDRGGDVARLAEFAQRVVELSPAGGGVLASIDWELSGQPGADEVVHLEGLVTRWERAGDSVHANQDARLVDDAGRVLERAKLRWNIPGDVAGDGGPLAAVLDVGTVTWGRWLADRLGSNDAFANATGTFDGSIGIASGDHEVHFRIYRGKIVEAARRSLNGATFTVSASEAVWVELMTGPRNDFVLRTMHGEVRTTGSGFQYLRMIKALMVLFDEARAGVAEVDSA